MFRAPRTDDSDHVPPGTPDHEGVLFIPADGRDHPIERRPARPAVHTVAGPAGPCGGQQDGAIHVGRVGMGREGTPWCNSSVTLNLPSSRLPTVERGMREQAWPREPGSGRGRRHGTSSSEAFDRWFRYPAGFASDYVELLLERIGLRTGTVIDCFTGSGVTGTAARRRGLAFVGLEAHPLVVDLARLKLSERGDATDLLSDADELVASLAAQAAPSAEAMGAAAAMEPELVRRSFDVLTLHQLVGLRTAVRSRETTSSGPYLKWALLATLRDVAQVKVGWPYQRPGVPRRPKHTDPLARFRSRVSLMAEDLRSVDWERSPYWSVLCGDARDADVWQLDGRLGQACVASPPYLNNFDYADATRLELYFWGDVTSWAQLVSVVRNDMLTATTQQSTVPARERARTRLQAMGAVGAKILELTEILYTRRRARPRGKQYDQVVPAYFVGMADILTNLAMALDPGSTCVWLIGDSAPYGVYIDTPTLIGELAENTGFSVEDDVTLRLRGNRWQSTTDRHAVELTERLLVFRRE